jgi:hypothetical protein
MLNDHGQETLAMGSTRYLTLLDVIQAVSEVAASDQETLATVADLINRGQVRLCSDAAGATIDVSATGDTAAWSWTTPRGAWLARPGPQRAQPSRGQ